MGQIQDSLGYLLKLGIAQFVQDQGQYNGHREPDKQIQKIEHYGITQRFGKLFIRENILEDFKAYPFTSGIAPDRLIVHECHPHTGVSRIAEHKDHDQREQQQQIELPVSLYSLFPTRLGNNFLIATLCLSHKRPLFFVYFV